MVSALLWCELMNWLGRRPVVYILVPVMSRSLRVIMSAQRPPLSQNLLRLAPWESLHTFSQALQPPTPGILGPRVCWLYYWYPCSNLRLTPQGWKVAEECQSRSPTHVGKHPPAHQSIHINPFTGQGHLIPCTMNFRRRFLWHNTQDFSMSLPSWTLQQGEQCGGRGQFVAETPKQN